METPSLNRLKQIAVFCQVIDNTSMRAAAEKLGMTPPAISQYISQLEKELGVILIYRSTRRISLSEAGERYYRHGKKMLMAAEDAHDAISEIKHSLEGELRISAPVGLASQPLAQALKGLLLKNPELRLTVLASDAGSNLVSEQIDIAIRIGKPESSSFIFHPLGKAARQIYASPEYLQQAGNPVTPEDIAKHRWLGLIGSSDFSAIELNHPGKANYDYNPPYRMRFNDLNALVSHVQEGLGLAVLPALEVQHLVKAGALLKVLPDWHLNTLPLYALTINRKQSYKVKAVLKALKDFFA
ncbi:LysR family transcriptional regulator [Thalassomonas sp. RHCl1]|uniref:LysR family transcriptional regulator n=1 Tax=Thalassomonas sp. RHCl1 TaxID=2995320 RepID=UPI00248CFE91|nr:LysR family transcriptional regulator [Thalassomonas sp. RHCl1]